MTDTDAGDHPTPTTSGADATGSTEPSRPARDAAASSAAPTTSTGSADAAAGAAALRADAGSSEGGSNAGDGEGGGEGSGEGGPKPRRRGSRGGRNRNRPRPEGAEGDASSDDGDGDASTDGTSGGAPRPQGQRAPRQTAKAAADGGDDADRIPELPDKHRENKPSAEAAEAALVRKPQIGDTRPAPAEPAAADATSDAASGQGGQPGEPGSGRRRRRRGGRGRGGGSGQGGQGGQGGQANGGGQGGGSGAGGGKGGGRSGGRGASTPVTAITDDAPVDLDEKTMSKRRGKERKGRPVGRYLMAVHVQPTATQIAVLEGKSLIEHYVSRPADDVAQIHGNIYVGKVQNVLPGMEAAFVDIGTPKNAVLYRGDTRYDPEDLDDKGANPRIEQILKAKQTIICQVTKNPIGAKGARLTQEISLPGRFVVLVPNSTTYGISKRLPDNERKRLRQILDKAKPKGHGLIVRTAAEGISAEELSRDVERLATTWAEIEARAEKVAKSGRAELLYRDPDMSIRVIREEFNQDYRQVVIDDDTVFEQVRDYVRSISPALVERVERYDPAQHGGLPIFETFHVHEQLHKALDRKVWLPSGGSLIIERTEALTVIDVNTGKNVGKSSLEETVFRNNLEAAEEVARQLRLRDIGGIIVIDFIDMEIKANREQVIGTFRQALARDKTRTQVFDISELGLVEMTRKRIGEGLIESLSASCPECEGRGLVFDRELTGS
jgi:ribonuclease E